MEECDVDADVDVRDPDEKSIMTYVAQFLQYSKDLPVTEEEMQVCITACFLDKYQAAQDTVSLCSSVCRKVLK